MTAQRALGEAFRCIHCGKSTSVANVAPSRGEQPEKVTRETHCACRPGMPAYGLPEGG